MHVDVFEAETLRFLPDLRRFALALSRDAADADDLVQETYLRAFRFPAYTLGVSVMVIAMMVAAPVGLMAAIYLAEYASRLQRAWIKPLLEVLAGIPTVVYGFFAALTVGPLLRVLFNEIGLVLIGGPLDGLGHYLALVQNQMALTAGAVMGIMLIPFVSSLSDDILNAVPQTLRDGSFAMGATKSETVKKVILPAALPGIMAAMLRQALLAAWAPNLLFGSGAVYLLLTART